MRSKNNSVLKFGIVLDNFYPVGAIITNTHSDYDPNQIIGGKWKKLPDNVFYSTGKTEELNKSNTLIIETKNFKETKYSISGGAHNNHWFARPTYPWGDWSGITAIYSADNSGLNYPSWLAPIGGEHNHTINVGLENPTPINVDDVIHKYSVFMWKRIA